MIMDQDFVPGSVKTKCDLVQIRKVCSGTLLWYNRFCYWRGGGVGGLVLGGGRLGVADRVGEGEGKGPDLMPEFIPRTAYRLPTRVGRYFEFAYVLFY